jgi:ribosomal-protein-alanine N-acetyltransferase
MSAVQRPRLFIEAMREDDLDGVMEIENSVYEFPWTAGNFRDSIRSGYHCRLALHHDVLLGYFVVMIAAGEAHLLNLSVAAAMQGRGHGYELLQEVVELARAEQAGSLFLEVRPTNAAARALYARNGFRQIGMRRQYYPAAAGREDALVLSIDLPPMQGHRP